MNRFTRKLVSLLGIAAVVFAQLAVSAYACPLPFIGLEEAVATVDAGVAEKNASGRDAKSPALCQKHCENGQQTVNDTPQPLTTFSVVRAFVITLLIAPPVPLQATVLPPSLLHAITPSLSIRHCCFLI